jgi:hypothetical protein
VALTTFLLTQTRLAIAFNDVGLDGGSQRCAFLTDDLPGPINALLSYLEGTFGALIMCVAAIGAILAAGFGSAKKSWRCIWLSLGFLIIAVGAFTVRTMSSTFKPVIYLYPEATTTVDVKLRYKGELTATYPPYDPSLEGWRVIASPGGKVVNTLDQREYSYLFWEGFLPSHYYTMPPHGFVVRGTDTAAFLQDFLARVGLKPTEYNEFIVFWYPQIKDFPYVQIALAGPEYDESAPLEISPKPDSIRRIFVYFKALSQPTEIPPQQLNGFTRSGFTVVEWGGTLMP